LTLTKQAVQDDNVVIITDRGIEFYCGKMFLRARNYDTLIISYMVPMHEKAGYDFIKLCLLNGWEKKSEEIKYVNYKSKVNHVMMVKLELCEYLKKKRQDIEYQDYLKRIKTKDGT